MAWKDSEIFWLCFLRGLVRLFVKPPRRFRVAPDAIPTFAGFGFLVTGAHGPVAAATLGTLFLFFLKAGAFLFRSGLAIVPFLYGAVVGPCPPLSEKHFTPPAPSTTIPPPTTPT